MASPVFRSQSFASHAFPTESAIRTLTSASRQRRFGPWCGSLSKRQAQVLALTYLEGLSTREVGDVLGCSAATVKTHLQRGRATLAQRLGVEEER